MSQNYDIIGDIHGCYHELVALLTKLGYTRFGEPRRGEAYSHPEGRKVIFVGDLIDRGPHIRDVLHLVKTMWDAGTALCVSGNHEYNARLFWTPRTKCEGSGRSEPGLPAHSVWGDWATGEDGAPMREHSHKNICQHYQTIKAFQNREAEWFETYLPWFASLPVYLDLDGLRVVHALWMDELLEVLPNGVLESPASSRPEDTEVIETALKGRTIALPEGMSYADKDGHTRTGGRVRWWLDPRGPDMNCATYLEEGSAAEEVREQLRQIPLPEAVISTHRGYATDAKPVFFGHYWLRGTPKLQAPNVCCLDYSVAKGDKLLCYRWDREQQLDESKFVYVEVEKEE